MKSRFFTAEEIDRNIDALNSRISILDNQERISALKKQITDAQRIIDENLSKINSFSSELVALSAKIEEFKYIEYMQSTQMRVAESNQNWKTSLPQEMQKYTDPSEEMRMQKLKDLSQAQETRNELRINKWKLETQSIEIAANKRLVEQEISSLEKTNATLAPFAHAGEENKLSLQQQLEELRQLKIAQRRSSPQLFTTSSSSQTTENNDLSSELASELEQTSVSISSPPR